MEPHEPSNQLDPESGDRYQKWVCPNCGTLTVVPILVGFPDDEGFEAAEAGHVILQGCIVYGDEPKRGVTCKQCDWFGERLPGNRIRQIPRPQAFDNRGIFDLDDIEINNTDTSS